MSHEHSHSHNSPQESLALLGYMVEHNKHHAEELREIANGLPSDVSALISEALCDLEKGNTKLEQAYKKARGE